MMFQHSRRGATLLELIIFLAVLGMVIATALPLLFSATENRLLQQTISTVEQNGTQIVQNAGIYIRNAERIVQPAIGQTGSVLVLQTSSGATNPTIIGISSGSLSVIEFDLLEHISSPQVAVQHFEVRNTSTSADRQSVAISFRISRTIRLQQPHSYAQNFETTFSLMPDDVTEGDDCQCMPASCDGGDIFQWQICDAGNCMSASAQMDCDVN
jgi:type II secretory pathway pseudopilin PulG